MRFRGVGARLPSLASEPSSGHTARPSAVARGTGACALQWGWFAHLVCVRNGAAAAEILLLCRSEMLLLVFSSDCTANTSGCCAFCHYVTTHSQHCLRGDLARTKPAILAAPVLHTHPLSAMARTSPGDWLKSILGRPVQVKLHSGEVFKGVCLERLRSLAYHGIGCLQV